MSAMQTIALPRVYSDAVAVCANPKDYANRHASILLALDATLDAFDAARAAPSV